MGLSDKLRCADTDLFVTFWLAKVLDFLTTMLLLTKLKVVTRAIKRELRDVEHVRFI